MIMRAIKLYLILMTLKLIRKHLLAQKSISIQIWVIWKIFSSKSDSID